MTAALALDPWIPIAKRPGSPTSILLSIGVGCLMLAGLRAAVDAPAPDLVDLARRGVAWPIVTIGRNAIVVFLLERVVTVVEVDGEPLLRTLIDGWVPAHGARAYLLGGLTSLGLILVVTSVMRAMRWYVAL